MKKNYSTKMGEIYQITLPQEDKRNLQFKQYGITCNIKIQSKFGNVHDEQKQSNLIRGGCNRDDAGLRRYEDQ